MGPILKEDNKQGKKKWMGDKKRASYYGTQENII